ncbi:MAG: hypothetical protein V4642_05935 [Bacteroidota bacterium]
MEFHIIFKTFLKALKDNYSQAKINIMTMKTVRAIIIIMTAAIGFSACQSPEDITGNQNIIPVGAAPIKSISVEIQKLNEPNVTELRSTALKTEFSNNSNYVTLNSNTSHISLDLNVIAPVPPGLDGVFVNSIELFTRDIVADGRIYTIKRGDRSGDISAIFGTTTIYTEQGFSHSASQTISPTEQNQFATIQFTTDTKNSRIIGDMVAYMAKDTVIRIPFDSSVEDGDAIIARYQAMGFEPKLDQGFKIEGTDVVFAATQVLINLQSKITIQY